MNVCVRACVCAHSPWALCGRHGARGKIFAANALFFHFIPAGCALLTMGICGNQIGTLRPVGPGMPRAAKVSKKVTWGSELSFWERSCRSPKLPPPVLSWVTSGKLPSLSVPQ